MRCSYLQVVGGAVLTGALGMPYALADDGPILEELVVTAKKRAQNLQDVAGSIQAIGSEDMARNQINGFDDYARLVPSLNVLNSGGGQTQIAMRGIISARLNHAQPQVRSTSGLYLEDIPITTSAFNPDAGLADIERIEVLRGPQGTLYGASAMSGAIRIIPVAPNFEDTEGELSASVSTTEDGGQNYTVKGIINLPLSDSFAVRANAYSISSDGYIDNIFTGEDDINEEESFGGRLSALWQVSDVLTLKGMILYHDLEADGRPDEHKEGRPNSTGAVGGGSLIAGPFETADQWTITDERQVIRLAEDPFDDEYYIAGLTANLDYDWGTLTSVTSYFDREFNNTLDDNHRIRDALGLAHTAGCFLVGFADPSCEPNNTIFTNASEATQLTQELRISAPGEAEVQWVVGLFYSDQSRDFEQHEPIFSESGVPSLAGYYTLFGGIPAGAFGEGPNEIFTGNQSIDTQQIALFGEAAIPLGEKFELTLGLRWFDYEQEAEIFFGGIANGQITQLDEDTSESGVNPNVVLKYIASEDVNVYLSAAKGFRIGGLNDPIPTTGLVGSACAANLASLGVSLQDSFDSDELWNYELGIKSTLAGGRVRLNSALYYIDWEDVQSQAFLQCGFQTLTNDANLVSKGIEFEMVAQATEALGLTLNFSYTDSKLEGDSVILEAEDGDRAPYTPNWQISAGFDYTVPVNFGDDLELYVRGDWQYTSESFSEFADTPNATRAQREELNSHSSANIYLGLVEEQWEVALFVKNLTDERIVTGYDADRRQPSTFTVARPRTIGLNLKYLF